MTVIAATLASSAPAQLPPETALMKGAPAVTPLAWKFRWLSRPNTAWKYVGRNGRPLVVNLPAAPSESGSGMDPYMARLFYEEGYALGVLNWHDDRARRQSVREDVSEVISEFNEAMKNSKLLGGFDPNRIVIVGWSDDAFPGALLAFNSGPRGSSPICAAIFIDAKNLETVDAGSVIATQKFGEDPTSGDLSPMRYAANAPPTLLVTSDEMTRRRSDALADAIRKAGGTAVREDVAKFQQSDPTTYLGAPQNPSTKVISDFLRTYCPAKSPKP